MRDHQAATMILRRKRDSKVLMQLRDNGGGRLIPYPDMWNFPGGALEPGEGPIQAAVREMAEEFGIVIDPAACREIWRYAHDDTTCDHIFFCLADVVGDIELNEGAAYEWMTLEEITNLELGFGQAEIIPHIPP